MSLLVDIGIIFFEETQFVIINLLAEIKSINSIVAVPPYASNHPVYAPGRTLWHVLYDTEKRGLNVKFYLGEKPDPSDEKKI